MSRFIAICLAGVAALASTQANAEPGCSPSNVINSGTMPAAPAGTLLRLPVSADGQTSFVLDLTGPAFADANGAIIDVVSSPNYEAEVDPFAEPSETAPQIAICDEAGKKLFPSAVGQLLEAVGNGTSGNIPLSEGQRFLFRPQTKGRFVVHLEARAGQYEVLVRSRNLRQSDEPSVRPLELTSTSGEAGPLAANVEGIRVDSGRAEIFTFTPNVDSDLDLKLFGITPEQAPDSPTAGINSDPIVELAAKSSAGSTWTQVASNDDSSDLANMLDSHLLSELTAGTQYALVVRNLSGVGTINLDMQLTPRREFDFAAIPELRLERLLSTQLESSSAEMASRLILLPASVGRYRLQIASAADLNADLVVLNPFADAASEVRFLQAADLGSVIGTGEFTIDLRNREAAAANNRVMLRLQNASGGTPGDITVRLTRIPE